MTRAQRIAIIEEWCPRLKGTNWRITSRSARRYNCIAWAAGDNRRRWDIGKGSYWPKGAILDYCFSCLVNAYIAEGFSVCTTEEGRAFDDKFDTVVLYESSGYWEHAAKLLKSGMWSSKLGDFEDIEHPTPESVGGTDYGEPLLYMRRKKSLRPRKTRRKRTRNGKGKV